MTTGRRIRELRMALKLSQKDLAEKSGLSQGTISRYENDQVTSPRMNELLRIAAILECMPSYLMTGRGPVGITEEFNSEIKAMEEIFVRLSSESKAMLLSVAKALLDKSQ